MEASVRFPEDLRLDFFESVSRITTASGSDIQGRMRESAQMMKALIPVVSDGINVLRIGYPAGGTFESVVELVADCVEYPADLVAVPCPGEYAVPYQQAAPPRGCTHISAGQAEWRCRKKKMEDRTVAVAGANQRKDNGAFFAVLDGHGGTDVVDFVHANLYEVFTSTETYARNEFELAFEEAFQVLEDQIVTGFGNWLNAKKRYRYARSLFGLCQTSSPPTSKTTTFAKHSPFLEHETEQLEKKIRRMEIALGKKIEHYVEFDEATLTSGATALAVYIKNSTLYVANLGDSRCIFVRGNCVACVTEDHRLRSSAREEQRVLQTVGTFSCDGYLCGQLAVSRALGDVSKTTGKKLLGLSSIPEVVKIQLRDDDEFLVLACDGLFDVVSPLDAALLVKESFQTSADPAVAARRLVEAAAISHSSDNISVSVVSLCSPDGLPRASGTEVCEAVNIPY